MKNLRPHSFFLVIQCLLLLIPVNIYRIGEGVASGIQWIILRYQQSYLGDSVIFFTKDLIYVASGAITGKSAMAALCAFGASILFLLAIVFMVVARHQESIRWAGFSAIITLGSGFLFLSSDLLQYGLLFSGPAGFVIPVGIPAMLLAGSWICFSVSRESKLFQEASENLPELKGTD